jgi:hypothetical protein
MRLVLSLLLLTANQYAKEVPAARVEGKGVVEVWVFDSFGHPLNDAALTIVAGVQNNGAKPINFTSGTSLPYGTYRISATLSGFQRATRVFTVSGPYRVLVIAIRPEEIEQTSAVYPVAGRVLDYGRHLHCRIVRLVPVLLDHAASEAKVSAQGEFVLEAVPPGRYTAVLLGTHGVCATADVSILLHHSGSIVLKPDSKQR